MGAFLEYLLEVIFFVAIARMLYSALRGFFSPRPRAQGRQSSTATASRTGSSGETARDPECGMFVSTEVSRRLRWNGQVLHFCSEECLEKYQSRSRAS